MYADDMPRMREHAKRSPDGLLDVITFVLLTIQQPLQSVPATMQDVRENGEASKYLFGSKRPGYVYARDNAEYLWRVWQDIEARPDSTHRKADLIEFFMQVPGLGMVKAAFVVQCIGGGTACLDTHNLKRLGMSEGSVKVSPKLRPATRRRKIIDYVKLCDAHGGPAYWWDTWCSFVAGRRGSPLKTPEAVSSLHADVLVA